ncbi:S41 family peptidase [Actinacidiphila rubida]|uniref:N-terminal domain of Peptidase_S41 n=1 Tax=Actinacidiphila rubida TaxID=310780 RepID=A0A1H8G587_9ACTN|nr:S41 family peptidase [Actinacidiphila rubida]SEN38925.1 N-terminal domain of Peptidase_S41 [Actinacidiphila rubida]
MTTTTQSGSALAAAVDETIGLLTENYVFPEIAGQIAAVLRRRLADGAYAVDDAGELARLVTDDLQSVNGDLHLRLLFHADEVPSGQGEATLAGLREEFDSSLGGAPRVEMLDGRVAVLELGPVIFPIEWAAEPLGAALNLVAPARALILDLRRCRGGVPETVALVCSYLLDERTHLNTQVWKRGEVQEQSWSATHVPGARFGGTKPLYVLTSPATFSGGEELAYDLQQLGRAVVVGECTGGGAHPREGWTVHPHLEATIPVGRSVNPVSGANWEGTGVQPDVAVPAADALTRAHELALEKLAAEAAEVTAADR